MATKVILRWLIFMELIKQGNFYLVKILFPLRVGRGELNFRLTFVLSTNPSPSKGLGV